MPDRRVTTVHKAEPVLRDGEVEARTLDITEPLPDLMKMSLSEVRVFYNAQAAAVHGALIAALPGGTLDSLFAVMAADRASLWRVPRPAPENEEQVPTAAWLASNAVLHERQSAALHELRLAGEPVERLRAGIRALTGWASDPDEALASGPEAST